MNLTAITDPSEIVVKHFLDSLLLSKFLPERDDLPSPILEQVRDFGDPPYRFYAQRPD